MWQTKFRRPRPDISATLYVLIFSLVGILHWNSVSYHSKRHNETTNALLRLKDVTTERYAELRKITMATEDLVSVKRILEKSLQYERSDMLNVIDNECAIGQLKASLEQELAEEMNRLREETKQIEKSDIENQDGMLRQLDTEVSRLQEEVRQAESLLHDIQRKLFKSRRSIPLAASLPRIDEDFIESFFQRLLQPSYTGSIALTRMNCPRNGNPIKFPSAEGEKAHIGYSSQILFDILPDKDVFRRESPNEFKYNTCAVVGNSGILLKYQSGEYIDEHNAVIRFNRGPTVGFEEYVGSKTTVRFVDRKNFGYQEQTSEIVLHQVATEQTFKDFLNLKNDFPNSNAHIISPDFHAFVMEGVDEMVSSWFYGLVYALQFCNQISIFGYVQHAGENRSLQEDFPYHYFDSESPLQSELSAHNTEEIILDELVRRGNNRVEFAEPCIHPDDCQNPFCGGPEENRGLITEMARSRCVAPEVGFCSCQSKIPIPRHGFCQHDEQSDCFWRCSNQSMVNIASADCDVNSRRKEIIQN